MKVIRTILVMLLIGAGILNAGYITRPLQAVLDTLSPSNKTWVSVHLLEKPNLSRFPQRAYAQKVTYLKEFSQRTQRPLIYFVNSFGNKIDSLKSFWIYNGFTLKATKPAILAIASRSEVEFVNGGENVLIEEPSGQAQPPPTPIEWNIERVGANQVWLDGYTGNGIVVCIFDHGMREDHEAWWSNENENKWRRIFPYPDYTYAWNDAEPPPNHHDQPYDYTSHGTHVGGIAIGGDGWGGFLRDIGVAPGAKLIACTWGREAIFDRMHSCFQWIAELTNTPYGNLAPQVVNGSWGIRNFTGTSLEFWPDILTLRALNIIPVFAIGNLSIIGDRNLPPGNYPTTIGVSATDYLE